MSEKASKGRFLKPVTKEKERRKRKSEEKERRRREKSKSFTLSDYNSCRLWPKKLFDAKSPFGDNVIKNPARYRILR